MRIDELPYHSSPFYKLNFVSRRQFFINIGKNIPQKCKKCEMTNFCTTKSIKVFLVKDYFFEDLYFVKNIHKFLGPVLQKVHLAPQVRHLRDGFNAM